MTNATVEPTTTTTTTNTDRTAEEIFNSLNNGEYLTKDGRLVVARSYRGLTVYTNPSKKYCDTTTVSLNSENLEELADLLSLSDAIIDKKDAEGGVDDAVWSINKRCNDNKDKESVFNGI